MFKIIICILAGLGAGLGTGFAGMSAAAVISPMLITFLHMDPYLAVGIALASDVLASAASAYTYGKNKNLDIKNGVIMMISVLCFTLVGSYIASIVPSATMTIHPVRHSGMILGVPQTMRWFEQMQERITGFVAAHSGMTEKRYTELMLRTGELVMDVGTVLDGRKAVREKLIDQLGGISDALEWLYQEIEKG